MDARLRSESVSQEMHMKLARCLVMTACLTGLGLSACGGAIPPSIRQFASELPARADGQYAVLDDALRKQLVMKDSLLACRIDLEDKKSESDSGACRCTKSASQDWKQDCKDWLGAHTPH